MPLMSFRSALSGRTARLLRFGWRRRRVRGLLLPAGGVRVGACLRGQHRAGQGLRPQQGARVGVLRRSHTADSRPHGRDRPCRFLDRQGPVLGDPRLARNGLASRPSKPECSWLPGNCTPCTMRGQNRLVRVVVTRIDPDGTLHRRMVDTAQQSDRQLWRISPLALSVVLCRTAQPLVSPSTTSAWMTTWSSPPSTTSLGPCATL
jgi:hypothetical protein